tara:strand:+ start:446 stop:1210 length:765 start_codon:yes stop_codon:yes gene_type:complete
MSKIPLPNRQLRRHAFTIQPKHIIHQDLLIMSSIEEINQHFAKWWEQFKCHEQPEHLKYLAASLEITPQFDKHGNPNINWGKYHVNGVVFWKKQVRMSTQWNQIGIPAAHLMVVQNPHAVIDYCTASGSHTDKDHIEIHEVMPTGNRPHQGVRSRQILTDDMIERVKAGQSLKQIWEQNPRIVAHFGIRKLREFMELQEFCNSIREKGSVTGFSSGETPDIITTSPKRVSREGAALHSERDTDSFASRFRDEGE